MNRKLLTVIFLLGLLTSCKKESPVNTDIDIKGRWVTDFVYRTGDDTSAEQLFYEYVYDFLDANTLLVEKYYNGEIRSIEQYQYSINGNLLITEEDAFDYSIFIKQDNKVNIIKKSGSIIEFERDYFYRSGNKEFEGKEYLRLKRE